MVEPVQLKHREENGLIAIIPAASQPNSDERESARAGASEGATTTSSPIAPPSSALPAREPAQAHPAASSSARRSLPSPPTRLAPSSPPPRLPALARSLDNGDDAQASRRHAASAHQAPQEISCSLRLVPPLETVRSLPPPPPPPTLTRSWKLTLFTTSRCDGPPGPCHRCATSGIDCVFPPSTGPAPSRTSPATSLPPPLVRTPAAAQPEASGSTPAAASTSSLTFDPAQAADMVQQLARANSRLEILQATLDSVLSRRDVVVAESPRVPAQAASQHSSDASAALQGGSFLSNDASAATADETSAMSALMLAEASAASVLASASIASAAKRQREGASGAQELLKPDWSIAMPDVLERGIMTLDECEAEFDIFFTHIQPWAALLSVALDRQPLAVRARSPLLFHAILLLALYYRPRTRANLARYCAVSSLVDALLAPQILCPQAADLSGGDFVRAVHLLLMYKPVQYARLEACGVTDASAVESSSKMNVAASWMLRLLVSRVSTFIGLPSIADRCVPLLAPSFPSCSSTL